MMNWQLVISCEHATNVVPPDYAYLFTNAHEDLNSHRGWDPGALEITGHLARAFGIEPFIYPYTRLLVEPNRSMGSPQLFSTYSKVLPAKENTHIIDQYYQPYRDKVESRIRKVVEQAPVLHLGIHTFTPIWNGKEREVDIGILYDPARQLESRFSVQLIEVLQSNAPDLRILPNEPYHGTDDGFTTYLRTKFSDDEYLGIEIEVNQRFHDNLPVIGNLLSWSVREAMRLV